MRSLLVIAVIVFLAPAVAAEPEEAAYVSRFREIAAVLPYLNPDLIVFDHRERFDHDRLLSGRQLAAVQELWRLAENVPPRIVLELLRHEEPKIRTLALATLYLRGDPKVLPAFVPLADDSHATFPVLQPIAMMLPRQMGEAERSRHLESRLTAQTVGEFASALIGAYMEASGFWYGIDHPNQPGFEEYWSERGGRDHCLGWFRVALMRASSSTSPLPAGRRDNVDRLRREIDLLPSPYREHVLLWLAARDVRFGREAGAIHGEPGAERLASGEDLLEAARRIGPDDLLRVLQGDIPVDDPDMQPRTGTAMQYGAVCAFILQNARELLRPDQTDVLLALERRHLQLRRRNASVHLSNPWWSIAAADLQPERAEPILTAALGRYRDGAGSREQDQRTWIAWSMWEHLGPGTLDLLVDWFYGEMPQRGAFGFGRHRFANLIGSEDDLPLLKAILRDPRLGELDWQSLEKLAYAANRLSDEPVLPVNVLRAASHPLGQGHYLWQIDKARERHPEQTRELESTLAAWRSTLRAFGMDDGSPDR